MTQFWLMRRAGDVTGLRICDIELHPDGRKSYRVPRHKTEVTGAGRLIAHTMPPRTDGGVDLPHLLLSRLLADLTTLRVGRSARLFTACDTAAAAGTMTSWLLEGPRLLGVSPPVGRHYSSHSCRSGGATSARAAGCRRDAITQQARASERTMATSYIDALARPRVFDTYWYRRFLRDTSSA